jgi:hypothetical protein
MIAGSDCPNNSPRRITAQRDEFAVAAGSLPVKDARTAAQLTRGEHATMTNHAVGTREQWRSARLELPTLGHQLLRSKRPFHSGRPGCLHNQQPNHGNPLPIDTR